MSDGTHQLDAWFIKHLVCPLDRQPLLVNNRRLFCQAGHDYPVVQGVPVMLVKQTDQTQWVANASLTAASQVVRTQTEADPYYLDTLGVHEHERHSIRKAIAGGEATVDPVVGHIIAHTCGMAYSRQVGRLREYPIPRPPLPPGDGRTLLDLGCNWGRWTVAAARLGYEPVGLDPSLGAVLAARRVANEIGIQARYVVGDARYLPFRDGMFDCVLSYSVLQHFSKDDVRRTLQEISRVLPHEGSSLIQMPNRYGLRSIYHQARRRFRAARDFEVRYWSPRELTRTFSEIVGPTQLKVDCYFGLGLQESDIPHMSPLAKAAARSSASLKRVQDKIPFLLWAADSLWVQSRKRPES